jgi:hypothetical protein
MKLTKMNHSQESTSITGVIEVLEPDGRPDPVVQDWYDELELAACYLQGVARYGDANAAREVIGTVARSVICMLNGLIARLEEEET